MRRDINVMQQQRRLPQQEQQQGQNQAISATEKIGTGHRWFGYSLQVSPSYNANTFTLTRHTALHASSDSAIIIDTVF